MIEELFARGNRDLRDRARRNPHPGKSEEPTTFAEAFNAGFGITVAEEQSISRSRAFGDRWDERNAEAARLAGDPGLENVLNAYNGISNGVYQVFRREIDSRNIKLTSEGAVEATGRVAKRFNEDFPDAARAMLSMDRLIQQFPGELRTDDEIINEVREIQRTFRESQQFDLERTATFGGGAGEFAGRAVGLLTDPVQLALLPLGPGRITAQTALGRAGQVGVRLGKIEAAIEIPIQAQVFDFKREIESPWTFKDASYNVVAAALGGAALGAVGSVTVDVARAAVKRYRGRGITRTDEADAAADILDEYIDTAQQSPLTDEAVHFEALEKARHDVEAGRPANVADIVEGAEPDIVPLKASAKLKQQFEPAEPPPVRPDAERVINDSSAKGTRAARIAETTATETDLEPSPLLKEAIDNAEFVEPAEVDRVIAEAGQLIADRKGRLEIPERITLIEGQEQVEVARVDESFQKLRDDFKVIEELEKCRSG